MTLLMIWDKVDKYDSYRIRLTCDLSGLHLLLHTFDQDLRNLRPGKFRRRTNPIAQQAANLRAGQGQMILFRMRAGLAGSHIPAFRTEEAVFKEQRRDAQLLGREVRENFLGLIRAVVIANPA